MTDLLEELVRIYDPEANAWRDQAACKGTDPALFWPESGGNDTKEQAKAVCATCPVQAECREHAVMFPERFGIWGGTSEDDRLILRKQYRQDNGLPNRGPLVLSPCGTYAAGRRHQAKGEPIDDACREALRVDARRRNAIRVGYPAA
jgi:WhiB family transcriptional regulator, redox-sensing transcriptional regulator